MQYNYHCFIHSTRKYHAMHVNYVIVIHWVTRNYGSKRTDPEGAASESLIYLLPEVMQDASRQGYYYYCEHAVSTHICIIIIIVLWLQ